VQVGFRRIVSVTAAVVATVSIVVWSVATWAWSNALDTGTYVRSSAVALEQPEIQLAIAERIVDSIVGEAEVPADIANVLTDGARFVVASSGFATFWEQAQRTMHEVLRRQVLDEVPVAEMSARIPLTAEVDAVLQRLREIDPALARYLPESAPDVSIEVADADRLADIKAGVARLDRLITATAWSSLVSLAVAALAWNARRRSTMVAAAAAMAASLVVYGLGTLVPVFAARLADDRFADAADAIGSHMAAQLTERSWQLIAFAGFAVLVAYFPVRSLRRATREAEPG
jgi:hypothetical protein